jgi:hypothetical protein
MRDCRLVGKVSLNSSAAEDVRSCRDANEWKKTHKENGVRGTETRKQTRDMDCVVSRVRFLVACSQATLTYSHFLDSFYCSERIN